MSASHAKLNQGDISSRESILDITPRNLDFMRLHTAIDYLLRCRRMSAISH